MSPRFMLFHFPSLHKMFNPLMSGFNSSSDRCCTFLLFRSSHVSRMTITCFMFINMFFVNVQSCSVHNACYFWSRYSVIHSRFLSTTPRFSCRQILIEMFQPGRCHLLSRNHTSMHSSTNSKHQLWNKSQ